MATLDPAGASHDLERPRWADRRFQFVHPPWMLADFIERLRGVVPRLRPLLSDLDEVTAHRRHENSWSIAQNVGHLSDVEELWQLRIEDLRAGRAIYAPADSARFQSLAERHQIRPLAATVAELAERRTRLIAALSSAAPALQLASAFHERLKAPMRLVDCAQFAAEHDDHHLLRIRALRSVFGVATA
jgi:uncharacterized damage-inducible protein DinB